VFTVLGAGNSHPLQSIVLLPQEIGAAYGRRPACRTPARDRSIALQRGRITDYRAVATRLRVKYKLGVGPSDWRH
jgi:hypothetical protein